MPSFFTSATFWATIFTSLVSAAPLASRGGEGRRSQIVTYYGSVGDQKNLTEYCDDPNIDIIPIGFVNQFPNQYGNGEYGAANFANMCGGGWTDSTGTKSSNMFANCTHMTPGIRKCQEMGKKILISVGGQPQEGQPYSLADDAAGEHFAEALWRVFGPHPGFELPRPFDNLVVDGFDLDIEVGGGTGYTAMAKKLRDLMDAHKPGMLLTAAPQCPTPDQQLADAIAQVRFDHLYVQFYNTPYCSARAGADRLAGSSQSDDIGYASWVLWVKQNVPRENWPQLYIGLPGSPASAAPGQYINGREAETLLKRFYKHSMFGGVMLWDVSRATINPEGNFISIVHNILNQISSPGTTATTGTTTTTTTITGSITTTKTSTLTGTSTTLTTTESSSRCTSTTSTVSPHSHGYTSATTIGSQISSSHSFTRLSSSKSISSSTPSSSVSRKSSSSSTATSQSLIHWGPWPLNGTTTSKFLDPVSTSKKSSTGVLTTTSFVVVDPITTSKKHSSSSILITSSKAVLITTSTTKHPRTTSLTTWSSTVIPISSTTPHIWTPWPITSSKSADPTTSLTSGRPRPATPDVYVTTTTTVYTDVCPTGYTTITATITATVTITDKANEPTGAWADWPMDPSGFPSGFHVTEALCQQGCGNGPLRVSVTVPITPAVATTSASTSNLYTGQVKPTGASENSINDKNDSIVKPFTGGAAVQGAPAIVFSVFACILLASATNFF